MKVDFYGSISILRTVKQIARSLFGRLDMTEKCTVQYLCTTIVNQVSATVLSACYLGLEILYLGAWARELPGGER